MWCADVRSDSLPAGPYDTTKEHTADIKGLPAMKWSAQCWTAVRGPPMGTCQAFFKRLLSPYFVNVGECAFASFVLHRMDLREV